MKQACFLKTSTSCEEPQLPPPVVPVLNTVYEYSLPEGEVGSPDLLSSESYEWDAPPNLDDFFNRIYKYDSSHIILKRRLQSQTACNAS